MSYLVNLSLSGRPVVIVGAGEVAHRKVQRLLEAGAAVTVIAPDLCPELQRMGESGLLRIVKRNFRAGDLEGAALVVAATDDEEVNTAVSREAEGLGIWVNIVDRPHLCSFTVPAVLKRGDLTVAVATEGKCPALARTRREKMEAEIGPEYGTLLEFMAEIRAEMIRRQWPSDRIREAIRNLYREGALEVVALDKPELLKAFLRTHLGEDFEDLNVGNE
jgi:precorrin-2 dehydrogenase/sirohydrochlorin ferrochelatase